jgi:DNA adenine methylase
MKSFVPWQGGKPKQARRFCQLLPEHRCSVEVFSGAGNLLFCKSPSKTEVINDIDANGIQKVKILVEK